VINLSGIKRAWRGQKKFDTYNISFSYDCKRNIIYQLTNYKRKVVGGKSEADAPVQLDGKEDGMNEEDIQESKQRPDMGDGGIIEERPSQESDGESSGCDGEKGEKNEECEFE
jgi:hypothetical protein